MSGLVWKDILVMRKALRTYGLLLLFYLGMMAWCLLDLTTLRLLKTANREGTPEESV